QLDGTTKYIISPKLPPFWADKPAIWFAQAEAQFALAHIISDATKFHCIVANLDSRYAAEVDDIITNLPTTGMYEKLKKQLINCLSLSEMQRERKLLGREELGDRKPSQFLRHLRSLPDPNFQLKAANNSTIKTYGFLTLTLDLGLRRRFSWRFVIADVHLPVIGSDFLAHFGLLPDCKHKLLLDRITSLSIRGQSTNYSTLSIKIISGESTPYDHILKEYPTLTRLAGTLRNVSHSTVHHIRTTLGPPVFCRPRRLTPERMKIAKAEFEAMVLEGTARRGEGSWASPLHLVPKKSEGWRPCGDYRALNARIIPDRYPVRHIHDYSHRLQGCNIFSVIDLVKAYTQVLVNEEDIPKTRQ
ncbi:uncharacterized protein TNCT_172561, partial [Trichonephila clavata]